MFEDVLQAAGGLGLFLIGMVTLSQGLRDLAGAAAHRALRRFTRSPFSGALTGTVATALVQSSSVTTVSAVGFASAGLLTFPQALGIVFGANIGTTITGWIVALVGFKLQLSTLMPILVLTGALLRIFGRGRVASTGLAVAGFGLAFVGIEMLREGSAAFEGIVTPERFPEDSIAGRLQLVGIGAVFTLITQSSSAGVASALAAISAGAIEFRQAAALVIGMDVGTTVTAAIAALGASLPGRRTGWAHVVYNAMTAGGALMLLPVFYLTLESVAPGLLEAEPEFSLVAFHSLFNLLGVVVVLPFTSSFAAFIERLVPDRPTPFTQRLDRRLLSDPEVALRALTPTLAELAGYAREVLYNELAAREARTSQESRRELLQIALDDVERYLTLIPPTGEAEARRHAAIHVVDQLNRLLGREGQLDRIEALARDGFLAERAARLTELLAPAAAGEDIRAPTEVATAQLCRDLARDRAVYRASVGRKLGPNALDASEALLRMDAYRWLERVAHHVWRIAHHLEQLGHEAPTGLTAEPSEPD